MRIAESVKLFEMQYVSLISDPLKSIENVWVACVGTVTTFLRSQIFLRF